MEKHGIPAIRWLCHNDRFYLLVRMLGRSDALHPWIYARCRDVEKEPDDYLDLWAREHYKSTIITLAGVIQEIIRNPEITIGIFSHTRNVAMKFWQQIKLELETNDRLKIAFPEIFYQNPKKDSPKWSEERGLCVKRKGNPKEATLEAWGLVDGQPTGAHFRLRIYDDVVTRESVNTPEQIAKTTSAWELSDNLGMQGGRRWHIGTRYHFGDTYGVILERGALKVRLYPATDNGQPDGNPVLLSPEEWEKKKITQGPATIACHCAGTTVLMGDWSYKNIQDVMVGDEVVGYVFGVGKGHKARLVKTRVVATNKRIAAAARYTMASGSFTECTPDHKWWSGRTGTDGHNAYSQLGTGKKHDLKSLLRVSNDRENDGDPRWQYLAGILDGEGTVSGNRIVITQSGAHNPEVHARIAETLDDLGIDYSRYERAPFESHGKKSKGSTLFLINGGRHVRHRILLNSNPAKKTAIVDSLYCCLGGKSRTVADKVVRIEAIGDREVFNIQTETGNYVANGYASKNCQMLQNPIAGQQAMFNVLDIQKYEIRPATLNVYITIDPARSMKKGSANSAFAVIGVDSGRNKYLLDGINHRLDLKGRWETMRDLRKKWMNQPGVQAVHIGYESYGAQADMDYFKERMEVELNAFPITELQWPRDSEVSKDDRVQRLGPDLRSHKFYIPAVCMSGGKLHWWSFDEDQSSRIVLQPHTGPSKAQSGVITAQQPYRVAKAISRVDSDGNLYDLSRHAIEQIMFYPFAPLKDLIDAISRVYDMDARPPIIIDQTELEPEAFND